MPPRFLSFSRYPHAYYQKQRTIGPSDITFFRFFFIPDHTRFRWHAEFSPEAQNFTLNPPALLFYNEELRGLRWLSSSFNFSPESCNISPESLHRGLSLHRERQSMDSLSGTASSDPKSHNLPLALPAGTLSGDRHIAPNFIKIGIPQIFDNHLCSLGQRRLHLPSWSWST